jgi:hypothetical protein
MTATMRIRFCCFNHYMPEDDDGELPDGDEGEYDDPDAWEDFGDG